MELKIRVGAAVDRSLSEAYRPLILAAEAARAKIDAIGKRQARAYATETKRGVDEAERAYQKAAREVERFQRQAARDVEKAARERARAAERGAQEEVRAVEKAEREKTRIREREQRNAERAARNADKELARVAAARNGRGYGAVADARMEYRQGVRTERGLAAARAADARNIVGAVGQVGSTFASIGGRALRGGLSVAKSMAGGAGADFDLGSMVSKNVALETLASNVSNSGYMAGDKRNGSRIDPQALMRQAFTVGKETGVDANEALEGLSKFVAKTGDLQTGRDALKDMAILAKATGSSLDDMVDAAGDVATALPDSANKGEQLKAVMQAVAGMGKVGAVEMKDFASQMAKIAANAGQFEGDASKNILTLSAMAQESRAHGGSSSATAAATSVASFVGMLKTPARAKAFEAATGTKVFNEKTGMLRDPQEIIKEALAKKGMDPTALKSIFANITGARAMEGFATIYRKEGGGQKGLAAVDAEFERLRNAAMTDAEVLQSFQVALRSSESQANIFNNSIRESALALQGTLMPVLAELAPHFVRLTKETVKFVDFIAGKTGKNKVVDGALKTDVDGAVKNTKKQEAAGYILDGQRDLNIQIEKNAFDNKHRRRAEADVARANYKRDNSVSGALLNGLGQGALSLMPGLGVLGPAMALGWSGADQASRTTKGDVAEAEAASKEADARYETMKALNEEVRDMLMHGTLQVKVMEPIPGSSGAPGLSGAGRQETPEDKAGGP